VPRDGTRDRGRPAHISGGYASRRGVSDIDNMSTSADPPPNREPSRHPVAPPEACYGPDEFAQEFRASFRTLWLVAIGVLRDAALAEDAVQEAAIVALGKLDQFSPGTNFRAWMGRIVRFVAMNSVRKERKRRPTPGDGDALDQIAIADNHPVGTNDPADGVVSDRQLMAALAQVGEVARSCLLLRTLEEMPYADIANLLEIPEGTAMSHVHRTRRLLRDRLSGGVLGTSGERSAES